jgi:hypothetical protein
MPSNSRFEQIEHGIREWKTGDFEQRTLFTATAVERYKFFKGMLDQWVKDRPVAVKTFLEQLQVQARYVDLPCHAPVLTHIVPKEERETRYQLRPR